MWAHRFSPQPGLQGERLESFACVSRCRQSGAARLAAHKQAQLNCALPGFDTSTWNGELVYRIHMGRPRDYAREGKDDWAAPVEPIEEMGCPGAWYRAGFVDSVLRYYRRRDDNGNRIENPRLTQCRDPLVIEAVLLLEAYEDSAIAEWRANYQASLRRMVGDGG